MDAAVDAVLPVAREIATNLWDCVVGDCLFVLIVKGIQAFMRNRKAFELKQALLIHNVLLTIWSAYAFYRAATSIYEHGFCYNGDQTILWLFYYSRYYEMLDTVFLALRKRQIIFLHFYHHCSVIFVAKVQLVWMPYGWRQVMFWNGFIHTLMYLYYALKTLGYEVWWGPYLTILQIYQHFIGICAELYYYNKPECKGNWYAMAFGIFIVYTYLHLFVLFYFTKWRNNASKRHADGHANGKKHD